MTEQGDAREGGGGRRRGGLGVVIQAVGFLIGVALLVWVISVALGGENRAQLEKLSDAEPWRVAALIGLSFVTLGLNGAIFWVTILPERRLNHLDMQAINAVATTLSYLPFKLSVVFRFAVHRARDGISVLMATSWYGAIWAVIAATLGPLTLASWWRGGIDAWWWVVTLGGSVLGVAALIVMGKVFEGERGMAILKRWFGLAPIRVLRELPATRAYEQMHSGFGMLAHGKAMAAGAALRLLDLVSQAARFVVAGSVLGLVVGWESAIILAGTYFMIGMVSPAGMVGTREGGTLGIAAAMGIDITGSGDGSNPIALLILFVSATESIAYLVGAGLGAARLRVDRMILGRAEEASEEAGAGADRAGADRGDRGPDL